MVVALMPSPIALNEEQQEDPAAFSQERAKARRTRKSESSTSLPATAPPIPPPWVRGHWETENAFTG